jgi:hypothetical protein
MIPLRDNVYSRTVPIVNLLMIGICILVFLRQLADPPEDLGRRQPEAARASTVDRYAMVPIRVRFPEREIVREIPVTVNGRFGPERVVLERPVPHPSVHPWLTTLTCIFLHGGLLHLAGNLWTLWIFGDNVEDRFGHVGYLLFYLGCGVLASVTHLLTNSGSAVPTIGASGAIAGVMGAYFVLYPRAMVEAIVPLGVLWTRVDVPAWVFLGLWGLMQVFNGVVTAGGQGGGVAWWAHIGGFVAGLVLAGLLGGRGLIPGTGHYRDQPWNEEGRLPRYRFRRRDW